MAKPKVVDQGKVIVELQDDGEWLVVFPDGSIVQAKDEKDGVKKVKAWSKKSADSDALSFVTLEIRR